MYQRYKMRLTEMCWSVLKNKIKYCQLHQCHKCGLLISFASYSYDFCNYDDDYL